MWPKGNYSVSPHLKFNWGFFLSGTVRNIANEYEFQFKRSLRLSLKKIFKRGLHCCSHLPNSNRRTKYWLKTSSNGAIWELHVPHNKSSREIKCAGIYTPTEMRKYLDKSGCFLNEQEWLDIGLGRTAEVTQLNTENRLTRKSNDNSYS